MELKRHPQTVKHFVIVLLIVPYGIETHFTHNTRARGLLLIVPYGIETRQVRGAGRRGGLLLIVPYGIETMEETFNRCCNILF